MKLKLILASALFATGALAAVESEMKVIGRFDYQNVQNETTVGSAKVETSSGEMSANFLRWKNAAKFNDTITGELTIDFLDNNVGTQANSTLGDFIDTAFITKSFGPSFTATIGKQSILIGGRENDWSSADMYMTSSFNDNINSNLIGLTLGYTVADQTFYVQHLEGTTTTLTDKKVSGVAWYGNIMNNMIVPIVSYHKEGTDRPGKYDILVAAGMQFNLDTLLVEADYLSRTNETPAPGAADAELKSMVAHVRCNHENFRPFVKFIMEDGEGGFDLTGSGATEQERKAYEVGLEYVPNKDEAMRYHVVYNTSTSKDTSGNADRARNENSSIVAGVKFDLAL